MKHTLLSSAVATALLFTTTAYGNNTETKGMTQTAATLSPKQSPKERAKQFDEKIHALSQYGFSITSPTPNSYVLTVKKKEKAAHILLGLLNLNTLNDTDSATIANAIDQSVFVVEIDPNKYASNTQESITVYYMGNKKEAPLLSKLLQEKKVGAYLTYNNANQLTKIRFKEIDEHIVKEHNETDIMLKNMYIDITPPTSSDTTAYAYTVHAGNLRITQTDHDDNTSLTLSYTNPVCKVDKLNSYLGKTACHIPDIEAVLTDLSSKDYVKAAIKESDVNYHAQSQKGKVSILSTLSTNTIDLTLIEAGAKSQLHFDHLKVDGKAADIDEATLKAYSDLMENPPQDANVTIQKMVTYIGKLYSSGMHFDYTLTLDSIKGNSELGSLLLEGYQANGGGILSQSIDFHEESHVKHFAISQKGMKKPLFSISNFRFGYAIEDLYNFIPPFMKFSGMAATMPASSSGELPPEMEKVLMNMGNSLVNHGLHFSLAPVGWDAITMQVPNAPQSLEKLDLQLHTKLDKNTIAIDPNNPMTAMMLLSFFHADGKLVLKKKDLTALSQSMPPEMIGMLMMFAKYEGDKAIFVLKFENGHLMINGQPLM